MKKKKKNYKLSQKKFKTNLKFQQRGLLNQQQSL